MDERETADFIRPFSIYLNSLNKESDRGRALVAAAQIDSLLEEIIRSFLLEGRPTVDLFSGPNAPMNSLFNKANLARALDLISTEEYAAIEIIRKVRNEFAHGIEVSFEDKKIALLSRKLPVGKDIASALGDQAWDDPRVRFTLYATSLIVDLYRPAKRSKRSIPRGFSEAI